MSLELVAYRLSSTCLCGGLQHGLITLRPPPGGPAASVRMSACAKVTIFGNKIVFSTLCDVMVCIRHVKSQYVDMHAANVEAML